MKVDAAGPRMFEPERIVGRPPSRQLFGEFVRHASAAGGKLISIQPLTADRGENGLFESHRVVGRFWACQGQGSSFEVQACFAKRRQRSARWRLARSRYPIRQAAT